MALSSFSKGGRARILAIARGCVCAVALFAGTAHAYTADLALSGRRSGSVITQTQTQTLELELTNLGPALAPNASVRGLGFPPDVIVTVSAGCQVTLAPSEFEPTWTVYRWEPGALAVGETKFCSYSFQARPTARNITFLPAQSIVSDAARTDGNPFNDHVTLPDFVVSATDVLTDVTLTVAQTPAGIISPGSTGALTVSVHNAGPDSAPNVVVLTSYTYGAGGKIRLFGRPDTSCTLFFEDVGTQVGGLRTALISLGTVAAGQTVTCIFGVEVFPTASGSLPLNFNAQNLGFGVSEPNLSNNVAGLILQFTAFPVPTLTSAGIGLLGLAALVVALLRRGRFLTRS